MSAATTEVWHVYLAWDAAGEPLYVGHTGSLYGPRKGQGRLHQHRRDDLWWSEVALFSVWNFETKRDATEAERYAIHFLRPRFNRTVSGSPIPGDDEYAGIAA